MDEKNLNWDDLKIFLAVARAGGLSAAIASTDKSAPTLSRRILALEHATGQELFERLPRGYALTADGKALLKEVEAIESQVARFDRSNAHDKKVLVKISAGNWMSAALMRHSQDLIKQNPNAQLRFIAADQVLDISHRETIIGLRNHRPEQLDLACRRTGNVAFAVYAKNQRVDRWARVIGQTPTAAWLSQHIDKDDSIEVSSSRNALDLAHAGVAKAVLPTFIGEREKGLKKVSTEIAELRHEQWLVTHQDERHRPEVRQCIDQIFEKCQMILAIE